MSDKYIFAEAMDMAGWSAEDGGTAFWLAKDTFAVQLIENDTASIANDILYTINTN